MPNLKEDFKEGTMLTVYNFDRQWNPDIMEVYLPKGAKILNIFSTNSSEDHTIMLIIRALVDPNLMLHTKETELHLIQVVKTGHLIYSGKVRYINSFSLPGETWVFHAFEL